tara:strand:- start:459 stop:740 length:282 start_codon:yes stop_codon:yes gene_type:complete
MYATVSHWEFENFSDEMSKEAENKIFPMLKKLGAINANAIQTGDNSSMVVTIYPSEEVCQSAMNKIAEVRVEAGTNLNMTMVKAEQGSVVAQV